MSCLNLQFTYYSGCLVFKMTIMIENTGQNFPYFLLKDIWSRFYRVVTNYNFATAKN